MKKIIIVGATSGIGKELAMLYAEKSWMVGITGRREELLNELKQKFPDNILIACFDVRSENPQQYIQQLIQTIGGLDLLIYNAGYGDTSLDLDPEMEKTTTQTNVNGFVAIVSHVFNYFVQQGHGHIAATSSVAALRGNSWAPSYSASKAFMSIYAEGLNLKARKLKKNIVITDIRPGFMDTKLAKGNGRFWVASPVKAAKQIVKAIEKRKRVVYITKRWWLIGQIMKRLPFQVYRRFG